MASIFFLFAAAAYIYMFLLDLPAGGLFTFPVHGTLITSEIIKKKKREMKKKKPPCF
jgi:hypothetical protein